ncbi:MAG: aspartate/glutamate racemase family protein [Pseudomonadales bacterium]|nr:aspartate/glutamate racemase family protein [Pseudomonadales bacterium]
MTKIGLIAGIGPRSTAILVEHIIGALNRYGSCKMDADFPELIVKTVSLDDGAEATNEGIDKIGNELKWLAAQDVEIAMIGCNSAHRHAPVFRNLARPMRLINMIECAIDAIPQQARTVAIIGTSQLIRSELYDNHLEISGRKRMNTDQWQHQVDELISDIALFKPMSLIVSKWQALIGQIETSGVDLVLIACTDLEVISSMGKLGTSIDIINVGEVSARELALCWRNNMNGLI